MLESWYWWLVAALAGTGTALFCIAHRRYDDAMTPRVKAASLLGLILGAWGVLLAFAGGIYWLALTVWGMCVP